MKINLSYETIVNDIRKLAININNSDTKYDAIISIAGGGLIPGRLLRNYLNIPIYSINVKFYNNNNEINNEGQIIQWLSDKEIHELSGKNILIVDDLDDTRTTLLFIIDKLKHYSFNKIGIAVLYNKKKDKSGDIPLFCEYFVVEDVDNYWINFPWEMSSDISLSNYSDNDIF
jgi:hypoxanthine phosphoribosyltransferase